MTRRRTTAVTASPILVGAATTLVTIAAVFLSYNANTGLPFVPTYGITARVPDASGLVRANEVRVGGKRVGIVEDIDAEQRGGSAPVAVLRLKLESKLEPIRDDSRITVRPLSPLGLKYLELLPGRQGRPIPPGGRLPLPRARETVELDEVLNAFDDETRRAVQITVDELGNGFAGRGRDLNELLEASPPLLARLRRVARTVGDPRTELDGFLRGLDRSMGELHAAGPALGSLVTSGETTAGALADASAALRDSLRQLPPTEAAGTSALRVARPMLADAEAFLRDARPGLRVLRPAAVELHRALTTGIPVLRRTTALAGRLEVTLTAVERLSRDPETLATLAKLRAALRSATPTVDFAAPLQTRCNYLGLWTRNVVSTISEGDDAGTWFRTLTVQQREEQEPREAPAPLLHVNPYPHTGQNGECEAGNEPYLPGQVIGNVPGDQGGRTEDTP